MLTNDNNHSMENDSNEIVASSSQIDPYLNNEHLNEIKNEFLSSDEDLLSDDEVVDNPPLDIKSEIAADWAVNPAIPEPVTLAEMPARLMQAIEPMFIRLTNEVALLRQEINGLSNEVKQLKKEKSPDIVLPANPFKLMDEFLNFEQKLKEDKNFWNLFGKQLLTVSRNSNYIKNCWRKLLVDELAQKFCWKGTEEKRNVHSLSSAKAIRDAAISIGLSEDVYIKSTKTFFQFAKNRQELRKKYANMKYNNNNIK